MPTMFPVTKGHLSNKEKDTKLCDRKSDIIREGPLYLVCVSCLERCPLYKKKILKLTFQVCMICVNSAVHPALGAGQ